MSSPEWPFLAAGAVSLIGGTAAEHRWPDNGFKALIGTIGLTLLASATADTVLAPLVHAVGLLILLAAIIAAIKKVQATKTKSTK